MLTKILFTLLIVIGGFAFARHRNRQPSVRTENLNSTPSLFERSQIRLAAYLFITFMAVSSLLLLYFELDEKQREVEVEVVNTQSGVRQSYRAQLGDVGHKSFTTIEGRSIHIADIERIEIITP